MAFNLKALSAPVNHVAAIFMKMIAFARCPLAEFFGVPTKKFLACSWLAAVSILVSNRSTRDFLLTKLKEEANLLQEESNQEELEGTS